jgi:hypothetical protein
MEEKTKKKRANEESRMQQNCVTWFSYQYPKLRRALFSVPNGGTRHILEAKTLKKEGLVSGVSDLILAVPNRENHGLFIEMKTQKGTLTNNQKIFLSLMESLGYGVAVVRSLDEFMLVVNKQMKNR